MIRVVDIFEQCSCHIPTYQVGRQTPGRLLLIIIIMLIVQMIIITMIMLIVIIIVVVAKCR